MISLLILIFATVTGYDLRCPAKAEWRLRANVSCYSDSKYVCLFDLLKGKYEENCLGSDRSSIGSKLVFQPLFNLADCNAGRYQPIVFTTHGNSECILRKSKCAGEGQVVYSNESYSIDTACRCDYTRGYAFVSKPQNTCFCKPSTEDCSCFRVKCPNLSSDYQCITNGDIKAKTTCQEIHQQVSPNKDNLTVQFIDGNTHSNMRVPDAHRVSYIIIFIIAALKCNVFEPQPPLSPSSITNDEIHDLFKNEECGKHYFARVIFIGKNGVGKTSLMRRLLSGTKEQSFFPQSTDGIDIKKCNINVKNGKWSPCCETDHDLARLIQQMFAEKIVNENEASGQDIETSSVVQGKPRFSTEDFKTRGDNTIVIQDRINDNQMVIGIQDDTYDVEINENRHNVRTSNTQEESSDIDGTSVDEIKEENKKYCKTNQIEEIEDIQITRNKVENETGPENDENIVEMVSSVMESCRHLNEDKSHDKLALCALWDFAGQKDFYATHQVFLSKCAVFLLVTDSLESSYADELWIDFKDTAQYVRFWFDAIHCYWSTSTTKKKRLDPPIIVVCTNEDKIKNKEQHHSEFNMNLGKILNRQKKNEHLRNIYFVSNTEDDDTVFQEIRQEISNHAMHMNDWGRKCPLKWLLFQQVLGKMKDSNVPISTTEKLKIVAKHDSIGIDNDKELKKCLEYFHDIGSVIYFDEENSKEHVILDPKWLIDAFRCLVTDKVESIIQSSVDWQTLKENGELTPQLIDRLFTKVPKRKFVKNKKHLLEVMKRFDIIVQLSNSSVLYMPCMMESCSFTIVKEKFMKKSRWAKNTSWLCLVFVFLPPAFFNHILAWYIKQYDVSTIFDKRTRSKRNALYRQIGVFDLGSNDCEQLVVCEGPNIVALQIWNYNLNSERYGKIANELCEFINSIEKRYSMRVTYTRSFKCKNGNFTMNQTTLDGLFYKTEYWCSEHNKNHKCYDIAKPWVDSEEMKEKIWWTPGSFDSDSDEDI